MLINCTKKLQDELKIKPVKNEVFDSLFSWHANIIRVNRRKTIVLVNDVSGYVVIIHGVKAKDFKNIRTLITDSIRKTLIADCIKPDIAEKYLSDAGEIIFSKTQNRSLIARMNQGCEAADVFDIEYNTDNLIQDDVAKKANNWFFIHIEKDAFYPNDLFYNSIEGRYCEPIFSTKALVLKIRLDLEKYDIWRRVVVPLNIDFHELYKTIKVAFDWGYHHLHEFVIYNKNKPFVRILSDDEDFELYPSEEKMCLERKTKISVYLPKHKNIKYTYDFGDNWVHEIKIENVLFDFDNNHPICLEGKGDRPPEDVGGEGGYEEFIEIMSNPNHTEYKFMKEWYASKYYKGFNIDSVNRQLKHLY